MYAVRCYAAFLGTCFLFPGIGIDKIDGTESFLVYLVHSFFFVAVNCFVLISGYFRINTSWKRLFHYYFYISFYYFIVSGFNRIITGGSIGKTIVINSLFPFSHNEYWWFVYCYLLLMLFAPLINRALENIERRSFLFIIALMTIVDLYFGYFQGSDNGFSFVHFIYIYLIGAFIGSISEDKIIESNKVRLVAISLYGGTCILWAILSYLNSYNDIPYWKMITYNNPVVIIASISFFIVFLTFRFRNNWINWGAKSVFAAYLLQEGIDNWLYPKYASMFFSYTIISKIGILVVTSILWLLLSVLIDRIRILVFNYFEKGVKYAISDISRLKQSCKK